MTTRAVSSNLNADGRSVLISMTSSFKCRGEFSSYQTLCEKARGQWVSCNYLSKSKEDRKRLLVEQFYATVNELISTFSAYMVPYDLRKFHQLVETFHLPKIQPGASEVSRVEWPMKEVWLATGPLAEDRKMRQLKLLPLKKKTKTKKQRHLTSYFSTQNGSAPLAAETANK